MTTRGSSWLEEPGVRALCVRRQAANAGGVGAFIRRAKVRSAFERNALGAFGQEASVRARCAGCSTVCRPKPPRKWSSSRARSPPVFPTRAGCSRPSQLAASLSRAMGRIGGSADGRRPRTLRISPYHSVALWRPSVFQPTGAPATTRGRCLPASRLSLPPPPASAAFRLARTSLDSGAVARSFSC